MRVEPPDERQTLLRVWERSILSGAEEEAFATHLESVASAHGGTYDGSEASLGS